MSDLTEISNNPLTTLRRDIRAHWQKYLPNLTARLAEAGELDDRIEKAARQTEEAVLTYVEKTSSLSPAQAFWQAWEIYREEWAFLPAERNEEDEAELERELAARYAWMREEPEEEEDANAHWWEKYDPAEEETEETDHDNEA